MTKLPCDIVRDLLPSYVDGLTNPVTNLSVQKHLESCDSCRSIYSHMTAKTGADQDPVQEKELNFLKKHRKRSLRNTLIAVITVAALLASAFFVYLFVIDREIPSDLLITSLEMDGDNALVTCTTIDSGKAVTRITGEVADGVLRLRCMGTLVGIRTGGTRTETIPLDSSVREIWLDRQILWKDGVTIASRVSKLYDAGHEYLGNMHANMLAAEAVGLQEFGSYSNELQTEQEPYGWTITYPNPFTPAEESWLREQLRGDGFLLIATIYNLDSVTFEYKVTEPEGDLNRTLTVTREEGESVIDRSLKECGADPALLQQLFEALRK